MCENHLNNKGKKCYLTRRSFIKTAASSTLIGATLLSHSKSLAGSQIKEKRISSGLASKYIPRIKAAFVRRKEDYGILWPGAIYDGEAALQKYTDLVNKAQKEFGVKIDIRSAPIHSSEEAEQWMAEAKAEKPDGLLVLLLDRQNHAWPTASSAIKTNIPTVIFAPVGTAFTTNTFIADILNRGFICSTDDFSQVLYGIKMIKAGAKLRETRVVVLQGNEMKNVEINHLGTKLVYIPARNFLDEYYKTPVTAEIQNLADDYIKYAKEMNGPTKQDVINGIKSYVVARNFLEREKADAITMDCLGALGNTNVSLPCIAWSKLNDVGVPAACEADLGAVVTHCLVQYLFDRPGFQQDSVPDTVNKSLIGAHCSCPTRLNGFSASPEPYYLSHHHGKRDAVPKTIWPIGQKVTVVNVVLSPNEYGQRVGRYLQRFPSDEKNTRPEMIISGGKVIGNISVPPSGGCVVSVNVKLDGVDDSSDLLSYPGFHHLFFYGDYKNELKDYCKLYNIRELVI